ncbi:MAG: polysulfide reductase NrfD [Chloroflexi bacterium]|nr:polysulfide reductase NrfD [Chloroflexota bacterium]
MNPGFAYPNELETQWTLFIVLYPYITGLVAGAFIVSSLYHVFDIKALKPVARMSLITALAFLLVAPLTLLLHLGQPLRGIYIFITPQFRSAMAGFGFIWMFYLILVLAETWLVFRRDIVAYVKSTQGIKKAFYSALALGVYDLSERSLYIDKKLIKILAAAGIPSAALLHGYVGFIFGAIKANPWWSSPLMPLIFLLSAIVSGIALLIVIYVVISKIRKQPVDHACVDTMVQWLAGFLVVDLAFEGLEVISMLYESEDSWEIISLLITQKLRVSFLMVQLGFGSLLPLIVLLAAHSVRLRAGTRTAISFGGAFMILMGVLAMRWNVVIGGQLFSKSLAGLLSYTPPLMGQEGVLAAASFLALPLAILAALFYVLPPWKEVVEGEAQPAIAARQRRRFG